MKHTAQRSRWLALHLFMGVLWLLLLPWLPEARSAARGSELQISGMLAGAGWLPSIPLAIWQSRPGRRLWTLLLTDVGFGLGLMLLATVVYVPLFFTRVVWFFPFALLPRGLISAGATRLLHWRRQGEL